MQPSAEAVFEKERKRLFGLAYRMLGSVADAEDIVQDCYLRWHALDEPVRSAEAWLTTAATRLAIDRLRSAQARREVYTGTWLPEPIVERHAWSPLDNLETASDLSVAFLYMLERLTPDERAAFVLREALDHPYDSIADILDKSEASCRQLVHRAKGRLQQERTRQTVDARAHAAVIQRYVEAVLARDEHSLIQLLTADAKEFSDGGGKVTAALNPIESARRIARFILGLARKYDGSLSIEKALVNGEAGLIGWVNGAPVVASFETDGTRITRIFHILNPDKLARLQAAEV